MAEGTRLIGRYALHRELASGGMAAVHLGRLLGPVGFSRTVAIKRLHSRHAHDPEFVAMFLDEARLVSRIKHPNVVPTLDVVTLDGEVFLVMEYVHGVPVSRIMMTLIRRREQMPINIAVGIAVAMLEGLHAAHEAKNEDGVPLGIVHRDVSPQNVIVGADGVARVLDFGIAKAVERLQTTDDGSFKGKLGYMPPDVLSGGPVDRRADIWGAAVVLWEMLAGRRLFHGGDSPHALVRQIVEGTIPAPTRTGVVVPPALVDVVLHALEKDPEARYTTAREMASALEDAATPASSRVIAEWLTGLLGSELEERAAHVEEMERATRASPPSLGTVRTLAESGSGPFPVVVREPAPIPPPPPRRTWIAIALGVSFGVAILIVILVTRTRESTRADVKPVQSTPVTSASLAPSVMVSAAPSAAPSVEEPAPVASHPPPKPIVRPPPPPPKNCNPPYTIGPPPDFIRKPKLECLPR
jgi:eukaryotic-like serine/threonine-protein kinase